jgi:cell division protein FtsN
MAAIVAVLSAAIYFSAAKVHKHKKNKRALKAQEASESGLVEEPWAIDDSTGHPHTEHLPAYHEERLPFYPTEDQPSAIHTDKQNTRHHESRLRKYFQGHSENRIKQ